MELVSALIALVGVLVGSAIAHAFTAKRERNSWNSALQLADLNLQREKLEELYGLISKWSLSMSSVSITWMMCMQGKFGYNDAMDQIANSKIGSTDFYRAEMLIDAYFPEGRSLYDVLMEKRSHVNSLQKNFRNFYTQNEMGSEYPYWREYVGANEHLESHAQNLTKAVVEKLRSATPLALLRDKALKTGVHTPLASTSPISPSG